jgi:hypothetical protein
MMPSGMQILIVSEIKLKLTGERSTRGVAWSS